MKPYVRDLIFRNVDAAAEWCAAVGNSSTHSGTFVDRGREWVTTNLSMKDIGRVTRLCGEGPTDILVCRDDDGNPLTSQPSD